MELARTDRRGRIRGHAEKQEVFLEEGEQGFLMNSPFGYLTFRLESGCDSVSAILLLKRRDICSADRSAELFPRAAFTRFSPATMTSNGATKSGDAIPGREVAVHRLGLKTADRITIPVP